MTAEECRQLWDRWERAVQSRRVSAWDRAGSDRGTTADTPDLGYRFARWMAGTRPPAPSLLHALIERRAYANIRYAIKDQLRRKPPGRCGTGVGHVREAGMLDRCPHRGPLLKAALFAGDSTIESVADALTLPAGVVKAFNDLYFNVDQRRGEIAFRRAVVGAILSAPLMFPDHPKAGTNLAVMIEIAENGTLEEVLAETGIGRDAMSDEAILLVSRKRIVRGVGKASGKVASGQSPAAAASLLQIMEQLEGTGAATPQTGSLEDPFLNQMLQDSEDYNEDFRRRGDAAAMERRKDGDDNGRTPGSGS